MINLAFIIIAAIAGTYSLFLIIKFLLPIFRSITISAISVVYFFTNILLIFSLIQAVIWLIFDPPIENRFNAVTFSMIQIIVVLIVISLIALGLVLVFGKSLAFKIYGVLAVIVNSFTPILIILFIYSLAPKNTANFYVANLHCKEAVFTLSIYLTSINISTYLFYGYDKFRSWLFPKNRDNKDIEPPPLDHWGQKLASRVEKFAPWIKTLRVPEWILHWLSISGGSLGAAFAQQFFRHKTKKKSFQVVYLRIVLIQIAVLIGTFFFMKKI
jgi:uncharacterized membrane protein YsdA (DUF1294 family)